jgi:hypothetical protein
VREQPAEPVMTIYLTNGVRTSQGPGPSPKTLPVSEANALLGMKYPVYGDRSPEPVLAEPVVRPFPARTAAPGCAGQLREDDGERAHDHPG